MSVTEHKCTLYVCGDTGTDQVYQCTDLPHDQQLQELQKVVKTMSSVRESQAKVIQYKTKEQNLQNDIQTLQNEIQKHTVALRNRENELEKVVGELGLQQRSVDRIHDNFTSKCQPLEVRLAPKPVKPTSKPPSKQKRRNTTPPAEVA